MTPIRIDAADIWQTTSLDCAVAEEMFGWRWLAFNGRPVRSHPEYPKETRVRRFYPPADKMGEERSTVESWKRYFQAVPHEPATGDEPLAYCYCSTMGPHDVPHFSGHEQAVREMERELHRRGLLEKYKGIVAEITDDPFPTCEQRCIAALAAVGSKYVQKDEADSNG